MSERDPPPPGPAFIQWDPSLPVRLGRIVWVEVPDGYLWCEATDSTPAGWVRPLGPQVPE